MTKIFIVEDDSAIADAMVKKIRSWGLEAACAADFRDIIGEFRRYAPQLVLMDITLPYRNGYHWCEELRKFSRVPVVFVSSASDSMNIVMAMSMGGDDFIAKPFDLDVMMAKVQAVLRRTYDYGLRPPELEHRGAVLDTGDACLRVGGQRLELTKNEFRILQTLLEQKGRVVSRETLMERLWETDSYVDENTLTVNVNRLRRRLDGAGLTEFIATKKGLGYLVE